MKTGFYRAGSERRNKCTENEEMLQNSSIGTLNFGARTETRFNLIRFIFVRSRKKLGDPGSTPMTSHIGKEKKKVKKVKQVDLDKVKLSRGEICVGPCPIVRFLEVLVRLLAYFF